jgi:hypothetical protein
MNIAMVVIMFFIVCLPFLHKYSLFFWIALFIIKNIMGKKFIISEDERNRILGLHETAKNNYGTVISEQYAGVAFGAEQNGLRIKKVEATEQAVAGQPAAQPAAQPQNAGVPNLSVFDKYVPTKEEVMNYVKSLSGLKTDEDIQKALQNPFYTKMYKIIEPLEVNMDMGKKTLPTPGENWREWYLYKGMADKDVTGNVRLNPQSLTSKAPEVFAQAAQKYDWENLRKNLGIFKEWAMANPTQVLPNRGTSKPDVYAAYNKFLQSKGARDVDFARKVAYNLGLINQGGDLTPLRNLS